MRFCRPIRWSQPRNESLLTRSAGHSDCDSAHRSSYPPEDSPHLQPWRVTALVASSDSSYTVDPRPSRRLRFQSRRSCRIDGTLSLEAFLCGWVRTIAHRIRAYVGLPSLGLVPLRGCLHVGSCVPTEFRRCPASPSLRACIPLQPRSSHPLLLHDFSWVGETRSVPCPNPVHSRPELPRELDVFLVELHHPTDDVAQVGRILVVCIGVSIDTYLEVAGGHPASSSQTNR